MSQIKFIFYDLRDASSERYEQIHTAIRELGQASHIQFSGFSVNTALTAAQIKVVLFPLLRIGESLLVIEPEKFELIEPANSLLARSIANALNPAAQFGLTGNSRATTTNRLAELLWKIK